MLSILSILAVHQLFNFLFISLTEYFHLIFLDLTRVVSREHSLFQKKISVEKYPSQKLSISLGALSPTALDEASTQLKEILVKEKAFCYTDETQESLVVVCLHGRENHNLLTIITKFLNSIEETEIRKTYKTKTINGIDEKRMQLLRQIGFVKSIRDKHAELIDIKIDLVQGELSLVGPEELVSDALSIYNAITEKTIALGPNFASFIASKGLWKGLLTQKLKDEGINGTISFDEANNNSVTLSAANALHCDRIKDIICESLQKDTLQFSKENAVVVESEKFKDFSAKLQKETIIEIQVHMSKSIIELSGAPEIIVNAKKEIKQFLERGMIHSHIRKVSSGSIKLLAGNLSWKMKEIEEMLKQDNVSIVIVEEIETVKMEGTTEGLVKCGKLLTELLSTIIERNEKFSSPNLGKLFMGADGQDQLKVIGMEKQVHISVEKCAASQENYEKPKANLPNPSLRRGRRNTFGRDEFTTKEGVKVSMKDDCIEMAEKVGFVKKYISNRLIKYTYYFIFFHMPFQRDQTACIISDAIKYKLFSYFKKVLYVTHESKEQTYSGI